MVSVDHTEPADIVDRLLWREAQTMLGRHADADSEGRCVWCRWQWPCAPRRLAQRAEEASRRPWREAWTTRHDLNSLRALPGLRGELPERREDWGPPDQPPSGDRSPGSGRPPPPVRPAAPDGQPAAVRPPSPARPRAWRRARHGVFNRGLFD